MARVVQPDVKRDRRPTVEGTTSMDPNEPTPTDRHVQAEVVERAVQDMRMSLTVVLAYAELLERRSQNGTPMTEELFRKGIRSIIEAGKGIGATLDRLDDACK